MSGPLWLFAAIDASRSVHLAPQLPGGGSLVNLTTNTLGDCAADADQEAGQEARAKQATRRSPSPSVDGEDPTRAELRAA